MYQRVNMKRTEHVCLGLHRFGETLPSPAELREGIYTRSEMFAHPFPADACTIVRRKGGVQEFGWETAEKYPGKKMGVMVVRFEHLLCTLFSLDS